MIQTKQCSPLAIGRVKHDEAVQGSTVSCELDGSERSQVSRQVPLTRGEPEAAADRLTPTPGDRTMRLTERTAPTVAFK